MSKVSFRSPIAANSHSMIDFFPAAIGSVFLGEEKTILQISMHVLLFTPTFVPMRFHFDISALVSVIKSIFRMATRKNSYRHLYF